MIDLVTSPWNLVLAVCVWSTIQTLKSLVPVFRNGGRWHQTLRLQSVLACVLAYQIPGPWVDPALPLATRVVLGVIVGTVTTVVHGLVSDAHRSLTRSRNPNADFSAALDNVKKFGAVIAACLAGASGIYGAWLKPETKARDSYELLSEAVQTVDKRVAVLVEAHNALDKHSAVEIELLRARVTALESELVRRGGYRLPERVSVGTRDLSLSAQLDGDGLADGAKINLPESGEVFK